MASTTLMWKEGGSALLRAAARNATLWLVAAGVAAAMLMANIAVSRGWLFIFGGAALLIALYFAARHTPLGLVAILVVFTLNFSLNLVEGRWFFLFVVLVPFVFKVVLRYRGKIVLTRFHQAFLAFLGLVFMSALYSENGLLTFAKGTSVALMFACYFLVLYYHLKFHPEDFKTVFGILLYLNGAITFWIFVTHPLEILSLSIAHTQLGNPNSLGAFVAFTGVFLVFQFYHAERPSAKVFWMGMLAINMMMLFASGSRAGILGSLAAFGIYWVAQSRAGFWYFAGLLALTFSMAMAFSPGFRETFLSRYVYKWEDEAVLSSREDLWDRSWDVFKRRPLTGVGFGVSEGRAKDWTFRFDSGSSQAETGSSLMSLLESLGLFGGVFGFLPLLMLFWHAVPRYLRVVKARAPTEADLRFTVLLAAVVGGFVNCQFEGWLYAAGSMWAMVYWYVVAVLLYVLTSMEEREIGVIPMEAGAPVPSAMILRRDDA